MGLESSWILAKKQSPGESVELLSVKVDEAKRSSADV